MQADGPDQLQGPAGNAAHDGIDWSTLTAQLDAVSQNYARQNGFRRTPEWLVMKVTEEAGELVQWFLAETGQGRPRGKTMTELRDAVDEEIIDILCHALLVAHHRGTDVQAVIERKWLRRLEG
ncbi:pyrophosphatase [Nocardia sp. CDC159]|uniref:Pyrophosphatase n=1 Tax=Nocardia pulmonis TaxID=2951408 RepID=A0A9X2EAD6_9NOCA|nr:MULTISPECIES: pyrophosphatase [Nocardia]MCM6774478.1 pyrophosphatase [Nocardia pulmonis]MCM6787456.1 pyrophosphatase [Nocardia sp. CDC159]